MTTLKALAEVLALHSVKYVDTNDVAYCRCGMECHDDGSAHNPEDLQLHSVHQASMIAALPGISIAEEDGREEDSDGAWYPGCELDRSRRRSQFETAAERKARLPGLPRSAEPNYAVPPGEYIQEWLEEKDLNVLWLAREMPVSHEFLKVLMNGSVPLLWEVAKKLERVTGIEARIWSNHERQYQRDLKRLKQ